MQSNAQKRILVVDDNEIIGSTLAMVLRSGGFHAVTVQSGKEALALLEGESFHLLLCDVIMPDISGVALAIEATKRRHVQAVLLMSGMSATADLLANARKMGYNFEIFAKPMHPEEVIHKVRTLLAERGPETNL